MPPYAAAGAELIETNTFGANPLKLAHVRPRRGHRGSSTARPRGWRATSGRRRRRGARRDRSARRSPGTVRRARASPRRRQRSDARSTDCSRAASMDSASRPFPTSRNSTAAIRAVRARSDLAVHGPGDGRPGRRHGLRHDAGGASARPSTRPGADVDRRQLLDRPAGGARGDRATRPGGAAAALRRSRTPACRAKSAIARSTWRARSTWPSMPGGWSRPVRASSAAAAAPRRSTSRRSGPIVRQSCTPVTRTGRAAQGTDALRPASSRCRWPSVRAFGAKLARGRVRHHGGDRAAARRRPGSRCWRRRGRSRPPGSTR